MSNMVPSMNNFVPFQTNYVLPKLFTKTATCPSKLSQRSGKVNKQVIYEVVG